MKLFKKKTNDQVTTQDLVTFHQTLLNIDLYDHLYDCLDENVAESLFDGIENTIDEIILELTETAHSWLYQKNLLNFYRSLDQFKIDINNSQRRMNIYKQVLGNLSIGTHTKSKVCKQYLKNFAETNKQLTKVVEAYQDIINVHSIVALKAREQKKKDAKIEKAYSALTKALSTLPSDLRFAFAQVGKHKKPINAARDAIKFARVMQGVRHLSAPQPIPASPEPSPDVDSESSVASAGIDAVKSHPRDEDDSPRNGEGRKRMYGSR